MLSNEVKEALGPLDQKKTLIITIGNMFRQDDGIGPYIGEKIGEKSGENPEDSRGPFFILNCYDKPENCLDEALAAAPGKTVIIDAALFGGPAGQARLLPYELIPESTLSTHTFPPKIIAKLLMEDTGAPVFFIGIQPELTGYGEGLSEKVQKTGDRIVEFINSFDG